MTDKGYEFDHKKDEENRIRINMILADRGVRFADIRQAYIDETVEIGKGTFIGPCVTLEGETQIGENCDIGQNSFLKDARIGNGVKIQSSVITESSVGDGTAIGPFVHVRPGSDIGRECKIGNFVEVKNSSLGDGTKASHLAYIGDADVGKNVNIGCGVVFVNYDGKNKSRARVEDGAFIGCNSNLIAPVTIGKKAYIGAGSTVSNDVSDGDLFIERARGKTLEGWVEKTKLLDK